MDVTIQVVLIAKRILRELGELSEAVSAGFLGIQKQAETIAKEQKAQNERQQAQSVVRPEIKILPPINTEKEAREARNEKRDRWKLRIEAATFVAVFAYAIINYHMLCEMRTANKTASDSFSQTLGQMQAQTSAQEKAASAAERSAKTANTALHISERAYISIGFPLLDWAKMVVSIPFNNSGRIPSGPVELVIHELTANRIPNNTSEGTLVECHWRRHNLAPIIPGSSMTGRDNPALLLPLPSASQDKVQSGYQTITITGRITYNDGFTEDRSETNAFCFQTIYHLTEKQIFWIPCDASYWIPQIESRDGYPNNEQKDH